MRGEKLSALGVRDFRFFWAGQIISFSGTWMQSTAQGWLVYDLTGSPFYLGLIAAASSLPILFFSMLGGVAADRFSKRTVLMSTQALSMIPALGIGTLSALGAVNVWHVAGFALALGMINAFDIPARQSFLLEMVGRGNLLNAIALNSAAFNGARILGPMAAGFAIAHAGVTACFFINAASFLATIWALRKIEARGAPRGSRTSILLEFKEGMSFIMREPRVRRPLAVVSAFSLLAMPFVTLLPVFAEDILKVGPEGLGMMMAASGLGAFTAAVGLAVKGDVKGKRRIMYSAAVLFSVAILVFANSRNYNLSLVMLTLAGLSLMGVLSMANGTVQLLTPDSLRGRVMSFYTTLFLGMIPIGNVIMGWTADLMGTDWAVRAAAMICLGVSVINYLYGRRDGAMSDEEPDEEVLEH